jgi:AcrR family transcriptional regulator
MLLERQSQMKTKSELTRRRIVEAAYFLFYRKGFTRVSMDEIAARAQITKRTLYLYFRSKDDLLASTLAYYSDLDRKRFEATARRLPSPTDRMLESLFGELFEWAGQPRWSGSGFTRLVVELADLPGHPARAIARRAKSATEAWLAELLAKGRIRSSSERAREMMIMMEGAMALMLIHGDRSYCEAALKATKRLMKR